MRNRNASKILLTFVLALVMAVPLLTGSVSADTGSIFTTDVGCNGVNINIFGSKDDVYLNGGPNSPNAPGLPDGDYYVMVTDPSGATVLGKTTTASAKVVGGKFLQCYQLSLILSSGSSGFTAPGYDDTPNNGDEYKVWASLTADFANGTNKTDNFKVKGTVNPPQGTLNVIKFYDTNADGDQDPGEPTIIGWKAQIQGT